LLTCIDKPKSIIFVSLYIGSNNILSLFKSKWTISFSCNNFIPCKQLTYISYIHTLSCLLFTCPENNTSVTGLFLLYTILKPQQEAFGTINYDDNILLSSFDTINLNSLNSLNIDTPKTIIDSKEILLGSKYATEPIILGDTFLTDFQELLSKINNLSLALMVPMSIYPAVAPNPALPIVAVQLKGQVSRMIAKVSKYKSKVSKSK